jgi:hypothetical protein
MIVINPYKRPAAGQLCVQFKWSDVSDDWRDYVAVEANLPAEKIIASARKSFDDMKSRFRLKYDIELRVAPANGVQL